MSGEQIATIVAALLLLGNLIALQMWRRARAERDLALEAVETVADGAQRTVRELSDDLTAARARAALATNAARYAEEAWNRAEDRLHALREPAPVTWSGDRRPAAPTPAPRRLEAVRG